MRLVRWFKGLFLRKLKASLSPKELDYCLSLAIIEQRKAMHEAYFSHQPFIDWLRKEKESGPKTV